MGTPKNRIEKIRKRIMQAKESTTDMQSINSDLAHIDLPWVLDQLDYAAAVIAYAKAHFGDEHPWLRNSCDKFFERVEK